MSRPPEDGGNPSRLRGPGARGVDPDPDRPSAARFPTTHWGRVVAAGAGATAEDRDSLAELCRAYWYPLYAFVRRQGYQPADAQDLTQAYFTRLIQGGVLAAVDQHKGRFRAFLRTDCGYFLTRRREQDQARKRGGGIALLSLDARDAEGRYLREPSDDLTPGRLFDRSWALTLLDGVLDRLGREYVDAGRGPLFERLQGVLGGGRHAVHYATIAAQLGTTEAAIQQAVQRLRKRYRALLCEQIAATLDEPTEADIDDEIRGLLAALGR